MTDDCLFCKMASGAMDVPKLYDDELLFAIRDINPRAPIHLFADCQQLKQIFINLFSNAHEAMQDRGELRVTISRTTMHGKPAAAVKVGDTGGGIPPEAINRIFNSFYTTKATGTGLGLPIANRIVTNHGGKIQVKSQPGIGAEFTVILPLNG